MAKNELKKRPLKLTDQERVFCDAYLLSFNVSEAARAIGFKGKSACASGTKILQKPHIQRYLGKRMQGISDDFKLTRSRMVHELACLALRDPIDFTDENGYIITDDLRKIPEHARRCIDGIEVKTFYKEDGSIDHQEFKLKCVGKHQALETAFKYKGLFPKEPVGGNTLNVAVIPWESMYQPPEEEDGVEGRIKEVESRAIKTLPSP